jgi:hypothetical protein
MRWNFIRILGGTSTNPAEAYSRSFQYLQTNYTKAARFNIRIYLSSFNITARNEIVIRYERYDKRVCRNLLFIVQSVYATGSFMLYNKQ